MDFIQGMIMQQQMMQEQQEMMNYQMMLQNQQMMGMQVHKTTRKDVLAYLQQMSGASEIVQVNEFETMRTRHICKGSKQIILLDKGIVQVPTSNGILNVEYFLCPKCKKLILNKSSLEML